MELVKYEGEEWSALYLNGQLVTYGDHYLITEQLERILNVESREGDDYLRGTDRKAATTLEEVEEYTRQREADESQADELRRQADELVRQAEELRKRAGNG